jgi:Nucleotidyl transferase AbiEii toxin, Type IV TA system
MAIKLQKDLSEFVGLLLSHHVEFLLVGGHALAFHGAPRFTEDIDFLILSNPGNASKIMEVMTDFGFSGAGLTAADFLVPDRVIQLGIAPHRIDLLTSISGVPWEEAWATHEWVELDHYTVPVIGKAALIRNKAATNRLQDQADIARLTQ